MSPNPAVSQGAACVGNEGLVLAGSLRDSVAVGYLASNSDR